MLPRNKLRLFNMHEDSSGAQPWPSSIVRVAAVLWLTKMLFQVKGQSTEKQNLQ